MDDHERYVTAPHNAPDKPVTVGSTEAVIQLQQTESAVSSTNHNTQRVSGSVVTNLVLIFGISG